MFQNIQDLKDFILWAKQEGVQEFRLGETHIVISHLALISDVESVSKLNIPHTQEPESEDDYNKTLFHSVED